MASPALNKILKPMVTTQLLVWFALASSVGIYVVVTYVAFPHGIGSAEPVDLSWILYTAGLALAVISEMYRRRHSSDEAVRKVYRAEVTPESLATQGNRDTPYEPMLERLEELSDEELRIVNVTRAQLMKMLVPVALNDGIAVLGMVHAILLGSPEVLLPFAAVATALNVLSFPRPNGLPNRIHGWEPIG